MTHAFATREGRRRIAAVMSSRPLRLFVGGLPILLVLMWAWHFWGGRDGLPYDGFTYLAAGERLNAGHALYGPLTSSDRPVLDSDSFAAPFLSPPLMAVLWRPLAALGEWTVYVWWGASVVSLLGAVGVLWARSPLLTGALVTVTATGLAIEVGVANVNSFILPGVILVYVLWLRGKVAAAVWLAVLLAGLKLVPAFLVLWLVAIAPRQAFRPMLLSTVTLLAVSVAGAGVQEHVEYLEVLATAAGNQPGNLAMWLGIPWASMAAAGACALLVVAARRRPRFAYLAGLAGMVLSWTALAPGVAAATPNAFGRESGVPSAADTES